MNRFKIKNIIIIITEVWTDHWEESAKRPFDLRLQRETKGIHFWYFVSVCWCDSPSEVTKGRREMETTLTPSEH